jgi:hypothetical protein
VIPIPNDTPSAQQDGSGDGDRDFSPPRYEDWIWRVTAWLCGIELVLTLLAWSLFIASGDLFRDFGGRGRFPDPWPKLERSLFYLADNPVLQYVAFPTALLGTTVMTFRRARGRPFPRKTLACLLVGYALLSCVSPAAAFLLFQMSPLVCVAAGDRSVMLVVGLEEVAAPCILAGIGVVLVVLPLLAGWLAVAACRLILRWMRRGTSATRGEV